MKVQKKSSSAKTVEDKKNLKKVEEQNQSGLVKGKVYPIEEAIELTKKLSKTKFDATVEVHFKLGIDNKKSEQQVRGVVSLPHGTGKKIKIAAFVTPANEKAARDAGADYVGGEELIAEIKKTEKTDFEVAIAEPAMAKNLGQIAKILGTRGLMPSPKNDTITNDPAKTIAELKKGKVSFKNDDTANLHVSIGKVSFENIKLIENFKALFDVVKKAKPASSKGVYMKNVVVCSTMGPGIKIG
jgi:large subunit ribosomal protein L1